MSSADEVKRRLIDYESKLQLRKKEFKVLLLGPGWPDKAKKKYRDDVKNALEDQYDVQMVEDFVGKIPLDDKFVLIANGKNLIAAILIANGGREGVTWELGFLEGHARGLDKALSSTTELKELVHTLVVFVQKRALTADLITRMLTEGMLTKVEARQFEDAKDLIEDLRNVCMRKLYDTYRPDRWP